MYEQAKQMPTKKRVLAALEAAGTSSISGGFLAGQFNISRNAVWKAVKELQKDGYKIEAVPKKGYRLSEGNDILSAQGIMPFLRDAAHADKIFIYPSLESTNTTAKEMAVRDADHGTIIIADAQTAGKGRFGRQFHSPAAAGIYMSLILHPSRLAFSTPTLVTAFAAVCVCEAIESVSEKNPQIKWVNDIFLDGRKICGILTEAVSDFESGSVSSLVAGIGINFRTVYFPPQLQETAGAVFESTPPTTRNHLAAEVINRVLADPRNENEMLSAYKSRLMMLGKKINVTAAAETFEATAISIDEAARLIVRKNNGEIRTLSAGEISLQFAVK